MNRQKLFTSIVLVTLTIFSAKDSKAQDPDPAEEIGIVLVLSNLAVDAIVKDKLELKVPVARNIKGIQVTGEAIGRGVPRFEFKPAADSARFTLVIEGTADAEFSAKVGPASIHASTKATFQSRKQIEFNGREFSKLPTKTDNCNQTTIDKICSRRRPGGRLVRRVVGLVAKRSKVEIDSEVSKATRDVLNSAFDEAAEKLVGILDQAFPFEETIIKYFPEVKESEFVLSTRSEAVLCGFGPAKATLPLMFKKGTESELLPDKTPALAELWLKTTPSEAAMLKLVADWNLGFDLLESKMDPKLAAQLLDDVKLVSVKGWSVIRIGVRSERSNTK